MNIFLVKKDQLNGEKNEEQERPTRKSSINPELLADYEKKASLLKSATGISFFNFKVVSGTMHLNNLMLLKNFNTAL